MGKSWRLSVLSVALVLLTAVWFIPGAAQLTELQTLEGSGYTGIAWSPGGAMLATTRQNEVHLWDVSEQGIARRSIFSGAADTLGGLAFSPDGATVAAGSIQPTGMPSSNAQGVVYRWEVESGRFLTPLVAEGSYNSGAPRHVAFSPDGRLLAFAYALHNGSCARWVERVVLFDVQTGALFDVSPRGNAQVFSLAFSPDSALLAVNLGFSVCSITSGLVEVWDTAQRVQRAALNVNTFGTRTSDILFSPDSEHLIINASPVPARQESLVHFWNASDFQEQAALHFEKGIISQLAMSPDGSILAIAGDTGGLHLFDPRRSILLTFVAASNSAIRNLAFSPDGAMLASLDEEGRARIWRIAM